jgi:hypothetical protein
MPKRALLVVLAIGLFALGIGTRQTGRESDLGGQTRPYGRLASKAKAPALTGPEWTIHPMTVADRAGALISTSLFQSFTGSLDLAQKREVAEILALYRANELALESQTGADEQFLHIHAQLLQDTLAQLRARLPESGWKMFIRSGLISGIDDADDGST